MKKLKLLLAAFAVFGFYSCVSDVLVSLKDLPNEDSDMNVSITNQDSCDIVTIKKDGQTYVVNVPSTTTKNSHLYFVDADFDGNTDILVGDEFKVRLLKWVGDGFIRDYYEYPIFSKAEKAIYTADLYNYKYGRYEKYTNDDKLEEKKREEIMVEVFSEDFNYNSKFLGRYVIKQKYTLCRKKKVIAECDEITGLPVKWQEVIAKMKTDYPIEGEYQRWVREKQKEDSIKASWNEDDAVKAYPHVCDEVWVDMGIESDDGDNLYWATSDLIMRKDNTFGIANYGEFGSEFGWGDITGNAESSNNYNEYGGTNPPSSIVGNKKYDIVAAHLNNPARLPSKTEWMRLLENCDNKFTTINRAEALKGDNGLPSWAQGQWMAEARVPKISGDALISLSVKIDGIVSSVIGTQGGQVIPIYEGVYDFDGSMIHLGGIAIMVDLNNKKLITENGYELMKVNNDTESSKIYGLLLTSRINGNKLFFPIPSPNVAVKSGDLAMEFQSAQEIEFWSGTVADEDVNGAYSFYIKGSNPREVALAFSKRYSKNCIRPVTTMPTTVSIGKTKRSSIE